MQNKTEVIDFENYRAAEEGAPASEEASHHLPAGTKLLLGQYTITGYLNCGGFGITYRSKDSLGREVVIKECFPAEMAYRSGRAMAARSPKFKPELDSIVEHFVKEAHRLASVRHENVVHVHQIFEENDTAYMAMDFIDGQDLLDIVEADPKRFPPREVEQLVQKMLHAIKFVHDNGMLHRDISPDNILINQDGEPILIDFGSAREYAAQAHRSFSKLKFVKDGYSPQEFYISGSEQGTYSDIYSFAASMYHVISGKAPEDGQKRLGALAAKQPDPYQPLAGNTPGYSKRFLKAIDKALEVLPDNRIQTADEWLELLTTRTLKTVQPGAAVAGVIEKLPTFDRNQATRSDQSGHGFAIAAGVAAVALLSGLGLYLMWPGNSDAVIAEENTPTAAETVVAQSDPIQPLAQPIPGPAQSDEIALGAPAPVPTARPADLGGDIVLGEAPTIAEAPSLSVPSVATPLPTTVPAVSSAPAKRVAAVAPIDAVPVLKTPLILQSGVQMPPVPSESVSAFDASTFEIAPTFASVPGLAAPKAEPDPEIAEQNVPRVALLSVIEPQLVAFTPAEPDSLEFATGGLSAVERPTGLSDLPVPSGAAPFSADVAPPAPIEKTGPIAQAQIAFSHWDVRMPFTSEVGRVRNANTATITGLADDIDLGRSGEWIAEGVVIYSFNGQRLEEGKPLDMHVLKELQIDPDGFSRATVRYRDPAKGVLDRGLLAVPIVRAIGLADGSIVEARMDNLNWQLKVVAVGELSRGLEVGDVLIGETETGVEFNSPEALAEALDALVAQDSDVARLTVNRDGARVATEWSLVRSTMRN